MQFFGQ
ncbi:hypothetical protein D049_0335A, partial [Vibrio parahaemolyticus VPTS-2010]